MKRKNIKYILIFIAIILFLSIYLFYQQTINLEQFTSKKSKKKSKSKTQSKITSKSDNTSHRISVPINATTSYERSVPINANTSYGISVPINATTSYERSVPIKTPTNILIAPIVAMSSNNIWKNMTMIHDTVLEPDDIINPILSEDDVINQSEKYKAIINGTLLSKAPISNIINNIPSSSPDYAVLCTDFCNAQYYTPTTSNINDISFPVTVTINYSNYKDSKNLDSFINKRIIIDDYDEIHNAYKLYDENNDIIKLPGKDSIYPLWALNTKGNVIICGWNNDKNDDAPNNNYPNKLFLYVKSIDSN